MVRCVLLVCGVALNSGDVCGLGGTGLVHGIVVHDG